jgi:hypothetical protein
MKPRSHAAPAAPIWNEAWGRCSRPGSPKRRFPTRSSAKRASRMQPERCYVYRCDTCGDHHLSRMYGVSAAIRYLLESLKDDAAAAARELKGPYVPPKR